MITVNDWVATTPFSEVNVTTSTQRGVAMIKQATKLTKLTTVAEARFNDGTIVAAGTTVYVKGDTMKHQWASEVLEADDGSKFIMIPRQMICAIELPQTPAETSAPVNP